jgi:hypothetical protein
MTQDEIIKMAIEAKLPHYWESGDEIVYIDRVTHFANLVAQHEREACAKVCEEMRTYVGRNNAVTQSSAQDCATAIRARG